LAHYKWLPRKVCMNPWADIVGPCFGTASLATELGVSRSAVSRAARELRLLRLPTPERVMLYPAFQLHQGSPVAGLQQVLQALRQGVADPWTWAQWLNTPLAHRASNIQRLRDGQQEDVLRLARQDAAAWAA
jgi:hypothetical protein